MSFNKYSVLALLPVLFFVPLAVNAQDWIRSFAFGLTSILQVLVPVLVGVALVVFIWGIVTFLASSGPEAHEQGKRKMVWGVFILFIILSVWGIVRLLQTIAGLRTATINAPFINY